MENSIRADAWALSRLKEYQSGKLILWSWVTRGYVTMEQVAEWYFDSDVDAATTALSSTRGEMRKLCDVDEIPHVDTSEELADFKRAESTKFGGEKFCTWAIQDLEHQELPPIHLPAWFRNPIDKAVIRWQTESRAWEKQREDRLLQGKCNFPPKKQKAFEEWSKTQARSIVLDKKRQAQVVNVANKSIASLKKHCVLIVLHMSREAEELRIKSGSGKLWKLQLLECSAQPDEAVPEEIDDFQEGLQYSTALYKNNSSRVLYSIEHVCWFLLYIQTASFSQYTL